MEAGSGTPSARRKPYPGGGRLRQRIEVSPLASGWILRRDAGPVCRVRSLWRQANSCPGRSRGLRAADPTASRTCGSKHCVGRLSHRAGSAPAACQTSTGRCRCSGRCTGRRGGPDHEPGRHHPSGPSARRQWLRRATTRQHRLAGTGGVARRCGPQDGRSAIRRRHRCSLARHIGGTATDPAGPGAGPRGRPTVARQIRGRSPELVRFTGKLERG